MTLEQYLQSSYTAYHAVENAKKMLDEVGFAELKLGAKWSLEKGKGYYLTQNGSALVAFVVGSLENYSFAIAESHTDSPSLKIKGNTLLDSAEGKRLNVEVYGGLLCYSMLDIPLKIAGRVITSDGNTLHVSNVASSFNVNIPSLCIHHNPTANSNLALNPQSDMLPLVGEGESVYGLLGLNDVVDADLYVVPDVKPFASGKDGNLLCSPRLDNLTSAYSSIRAIINAKPQGVAVACLFDNEEVGSGTKQGATSEFLPRVLAHVNQSLGFGQEEFFGACANGFVLSVDNGHAVHPAHPEKSDVAEKVFLGKGIVVKHHVNYATDGVSSAVTKTVFEKANVPFQDYYNRSDLRCGSTIGLISSSQLAINTCDVGLAQLAMHSAVETVDRRDVSSMEKGLTAFFDTSFTFDGDKITVK